MSIPASLTKEEAERQIAELQRHISSLPRNNHPAVLTAGMVFKREDKLYILHQWREHFYLVCLSGECCGQRLSTNSMFGAFGPDACTYVGKAGDVLQLKHELSEDRLAKIVEAYVRSSGTCRDAFKTVINQVLKGEL